MSQEVRRGFVPKVFEAGTPVLRADALDDDLDHEVKPEWGSDAEGRVIPASEWDKDDDLGHDLAAHVQDEPELAAEIMDEDADEEADDSVVYYDCYENGAGGWSYRPVVG